MPVDRGRRLNVHNTFRRRPERLFNVLCTFNLRPVSRGIDVWQDSKFTSKLELIYITDKIQNLHRAIKTSNIFLQWHLLPLRHLNQENSDYPNRKTTAERED